MAHYIDKDALVAEINRVLNSYGPNEITSGRYALINLRSFLDTLEVKEIDLEKEIDIIEDKYHGFESLSRADVIEIIKYFFGLGLAQKGE